MVYVDLTVIEKSKIVMDRSNVWKYRYRNVFEASNFSCTLETNLPREWIKLELCVSKMPYFENLPYCWQTLPMSGKNILQYRGYNTYFNLYCRATYAKKELGNLNVVPREVFDLHFYISSK